MALSSPRRSRVFRVVWHSLRQAALPLVGALAYSVWSYCKTGQLEAAVTKFGGTAFLLMYFQGQFLRSAKQLDDADQFRSLSEKLDNLTGTLRQQVEAQAADGGENAGNQPATTPTIRDPVSRELLGEADAVIQAGNTFAGLLTASVAFDHAVRNAAARVGYPGSTGRNLASLIDFIGSHAGPGIASELHILRDARNRLAHLHGEPPNLSQADRIWNGFRWAVAFLETIGADMPAMTASLTPG